MPATQAERQRLEGRYDFDINTDDAAWACDVDEDFVTYTKVGDVPDILRSSLEGFKEQLGRIMKTTTRSLEREFQSLQEVLDRSLQTQTTKSYRTSSGLNSHYAPTTMDSLSTRMSTKQLGFAATGGVGEEAIDDDDEGPEGSPYGTYSPKKSFGGLFRACSQSSMLMPTIHGSPPVCQASSLMSSQRQSGHTDVDSETEGAGGNSSTTAAHYGSLISSSSKKGIYFKLLPELMAQPDEEEVEMDAAEVAAHMAVYGKPLYGGLSDRSHATTGPCFMLRPNCLARVFWDMLAAVAVSYDICTVPLMAFDLPQTGFHFYMCTVLLFYWTLDIVASLTVGYHLPDGTVEMRCLPVVKRYLKTWMLPDVIIVAMDWFTFGGPYIAGQASVEGNGAGLLRIGKYSRLLRLTALMRLFRVRRLAVMQHRLHSLIGMESTEIIVSICRNLLLISLLTHIFATLWYIIGLRDEHEGWLEGRKSDFWFHNYVMSLQWSIANFTPGQSGVQPVTTLEFSFHVFVLFFALVVFSVFVSSTTSLITKLMSMQSTETQKWFLLKQFLKQSKFSLDFRDRVQRYVQAALENRKSRVKQEDVEFLEVLSNPLREELQYCLHLNTLQAHSLMRVLSNMHPGLMRKVSMEAVEEASFSRGDVVFTIGESIEKMCYIVTGLLSYGKRHRSSSLKIEDKDANQQARDIQLGPLDRFCEAALWTKWHSRGVMVALEDCELLDLRGCVFRKTVLRHHFTANFIRQYAEAFIEDLNLLAGVGNLSDALQDTNFLSEGQAVRKVLSDYRQL
mmetsp:Transcript_29244/g.67324  ORF Transcript_29244/g.67324 Transcript_29244/m.67324 type:complete len:789 (-) Transcript_29244:93-2459(-)